MNGRDIVVVMRNRDGRIYMSSKVFFYFVARLSGGEDLNGRKRAYGNF